MLLNRTDRKKMPKIVIHYTGEEAQTPLYSTAEAAGADLKACLKDDIVLNPGERTAVPTGLRLQIPDGFEGQVRPRSGLALKHGVTVLNSPGTIDSDYRGEVRVILINLGTEPYVIRHGDRIAQLLFSRVTQGEFIKIENLEESIRGTGGFGSTGV